MSVFVVRSACLGVGLTALRSNASVRPYDEWVWVPSLRGLVLCFGGSKVLSRKKSRKALCGWQGFGCFSEPKQATAVINLVVIIACMDSQWFWVFDRSSHCILPLLRMPCFVAGCSDAVAAAFSSEM